LEAQILEEDVFAVAFETPCASITTEPSRGPAGMKISISSLRFWSLRRASSHTPQFGLAFGVLPAGIQADPLELPVRASSAASIHVFLDGKAGLLLLQP